MTEPPLIDRSVIDDLFEVIGRDGARSVVELFITESRTYLATIAEAAATGADSAQRDHARRAAHSLKSGAGQIGAAAIAAAAAEVERAAAQNAADFPATGAALVQCGTLTLRALRQLLSAI